MIALPFKQVDVFTNKPFKGNPVAVIMSAESLTTEQMHSIANWTNLSETTFVVPPQDTSADYGVRIFTPHSELPFAGHPTIGTAYALLEAGLITPKDGKLVQECKKGLINLAVETNQAGEYSISFELPVPVITPLESGHVDGIEQMLGCSIDRTLQPAVVDVGPLWIVVHTTSGEDVLAAKPDFAALAVHDADKQVDGIILFGRYPDQSIELRAFAPSVGVNEDPVCGSGNGSCAAFLQHHGLALPPGEVLRSRQGKALGRDGHITLRYSNDRVLVGGSAVTCIEGKINV